jgi:ABC-type transport system substrate-binding protein
MSHSSRFSIAAIVLLVVVTLLSACKPAATPVPTATLPPTASATPSPTATVTKTPTATATPMPTPKPAGFYSLDWAGLSFIAPESWQLLADGSDILIFSDPYDRNFYMAAIASYKDDTDLLSSIEELIDQIYGMDPNGTTVSSDPIDVTLPGAEKAQMVEFTHETGLYKVVYRVYVIDTPQRNLALVFSGLESTLERKRLTLERVFESIDLSEPRPYGLDRSETIYQLSGEPDPEALDPALSTSSAEDFVGLLFSGLVRLTPDLQILPDLAESWKTSPDGTVYTFTLRAGAKFADGSPISAQDVVDSWERATDPELDSTTARTYLGDIQGVQEKLDGENEQISGLKALDDRTLQVTLVGARPYFLAKLTYPTAMVVDVRYASTVNQDWVWTANASGPFQIKEHLEGEALIFERNPNYSQPAGVRYLVYLFYWGGSPKSLFEDGEVDLLPISSEDVLQVNKTDDPSHDQLSSIPSMCTTLLQVNTASQPVDDPKVREALALSIDRDALNEVIFNDLSLPAGSILPPAMPGFSTDLAEYHFDVEAARQALQESSYTGQAITIHLSVSGYAGEESPLVSALVEMWKENLGINVRVENVDPADFTRTVREDPGDVVLYGWCADYPDPQNFLDLLYHSSSDFNVAAYGNPALDTLLEKARIESDSQERLALYHQVEQTLLEEFVAIPLFHSIQYTLINPRVKNYQMTPLGAQQMQNITIQP